jgi:indole-3-glycerol phosphate synthase
VDIEQSVKMADKLGVNFTKIAESGIDSPKTITYFRSHGFQGFLIGENFMRSENPGLSCKEFIRSI